MKQTMELSEKLNKLLTRGLGNAEKSRWAVHVARLVETSFSVNSEVLLMYSITLVRLDYIHKIHCAVFDKTVMSTAEGSVSVIQLTTGCRYIYIT